MNHKNILLSVAMLVSITASAQFVTSIGAGIETNKAVPVQLTAGITLGKNEIVAGYVAFLHREDAKYPKILFLRYGLSFRTGSIESVPLIGAGMHTATVFEKPLVKDTMDPVYDNWELIRNPSEFKILYGLKVQKNLGLGGLFVSVEHCKLSYITGGMFVKIN